jgi:hypothetical protein
MVEEPTPTGASLADEQLYSEACKQINYSLISLLKHTYIPPYRASP